MRASLSACAVLALAACEPTSVTSADTPARLEAEKVAKSLSTQVGQSEAGVEVSAVRVSGESVIMVFSLPTPGQGAAPEVKAALSEGIAQSIGPQICTEGGIDALYAAGGELVIRVQGADEVLIADVPAGCA